MKSFSLVACFVLGIVLASVCSAGTPRGGETLMVAQPEDLPTLVVAPLPVFGGGDQVQNGGCGCQAKPVFQKPDYNSDPVFYACAVTRDGGESIILVARSETAEWIEALNLQLVAALSRFGCDSFCAFHPEPFYTCTEVAHGHESLFQEHGQEVGPYDPFWQYHGGTPAFSYCSP